MGSCAFQCDVPHQWISQRQVSPVSVYCDVVGFHVLCLRHAIPVSQHIGQSTTATSENCQQTIILEVLPNYCLLNEQRSYSYDAFTLECHAMIHDILSCHIISDQVLYDIPSCHIISDQILYDIPSCHIISDQVLYDIPSCHIPVDQVLYDISLCHIISD